MSFVATYKTAKILAKDQPPQSLGNSAKQNGGNGHYWRVSAKFAIGRIFSLVCPLLCSPKADPDPYETDDIWK